MIKKLFISLLAISVLVGCNTKENDNDAQDEPGDNSDEVVETTKPTDDEDIEKTSELTLPAAPLQKLDTSEQITDLQEVLISVGYEISTTGQFDESTVWAITALQMQDDNLLITGIYDEATKNSLENLFKNGETVTSDYSLPQPTNPDEFTPTIENPYDVLALVNKNYALPSDYTPEDLVVPNIRFPFDEDDPKKQLRQVAATAMEELFAATDEAGLGLFAQSGYRSYDRQDVIFASNVEKHGETHANTFSARPGESEHQTGLVMDVTSQQVGFDLITDFGDTPEGLWIKDNAHKYGFIIRYEEGKEEITKYQYEPWHLRYVGEKAATDMYLDGITLEEYLGAH